MTPEELARLRQQLAGLPPEEQAAQIDKLSPNDLRVYVQLGQTTAAKPQDTAVNQNEKYTGWAAGYGGGGLTQPQRRGMAVGMASGFPSPPQMAVGGLMGAENPPKAEATQVLQGVGDNALDVLMNKYLPGAGYLKRAGARALGIGAAGGVGTAIDAASGNETESAGTQGVVAALSGLLGGFGGRAQDLTGAAAASPFVRATAQDADSPLARSMNSRFFRGFLRGNKKFAQETSSAVDQYLDDTFKPISQSDIIGILDSTDFALKNPQNAAFTSTLKAITKSQDQTRSSETILRTVFGKETTQANAAATFLRESLPPEDYEKISNAWLTHVFFRDALAPIEGLEGKGSKMLLDNAAEASGRGTIPYNILESGKTVLPYDTVRGGTDFVLSGEKLKAASQRFGKKTLENIVGPEATSVIDDLATVMDVLALDKPKDSWRNVVGNTASGTLRYQGNRFVYIASGIGSGLGAGALAGVMPLAAMGLGAYAAGVTVDTMIQKGVQNPALMTTLRKAIEAGDQRTVSTAMRALMASEATTPQAPPSPREGR